MKYIAGALFMLVVCVIWLQTRFFVQQDDYALKLARCERDRIEMLRVSSAGLKDSLRRTR